MLNAIALTGLPSRVPCDPLFFLFIFISFVFNFFLCCFLSFSSYFVLVKTELVNNSNALLESLSGNALKFSKAFKQ